MSVRVFNTPPGLDYNPVRGLHRDISFGVVRASGGSAPSTLEGVIAKRLFPWGPPDCPEINWSKATAKPWEILLPPAAPASLWEATALCNAYHSDAAGRIQDLAAVVTIRWPEVEKHEIGLPLHEAWECSRSFAVAIAAQFSIAAIAAFHVPARAWARGVPHVHLILPCRTIRPGTGFASFCKPFTNPVEGREIIDEMWAQHIGTYRFSRRLERNLSDNFAGDHARPYPSRTASMRTAK